MQFGRGVQAVVLGLAVSAASHAGNCPAPPQCPPPEDSSCVGVTETTITESTVTCYGAVPSETMTVEDTVGEADICVGQQKSVGFHVCPGTVNSNFNTETVLDVGRIFADGFEAD